MQKSGSLLSQSDLVELKDVMYKKYIKNMLIEYNVH